jgi:RNA polymerase sigma-70 factor (ECF subfamily)
VNDGAPRESDDEWAARVTRELRGGSREALAEIYDRTAATVAEFVRRATRRDESFALDCLQEMFMRLAASPPAVDTHAALLAWMRVTALNLARNAIVSDERRARREQCVARHDGRAEAGRARLDRTAADEPELLAWIDAQIDSDERALLRMRFGQGMTAASIAHAVGATPSAVESALRRLFARLRGKVDA